MAQLRQQQGAAPLALAFLILTAARSGEVIGARWSEFDLAAKVWTIPAERMKSNRQHRVPLSDAAMEILEAAPREDGNPFVFVGGRKGAGMPRTAMAYTLQCLGREETIHGFRSSFRDWAAERTSFPREICEMSLAHRVAGATEASYWRSDIVEKRRKLMEAWATFCCSPPVATDDNVVAIGRSR
jgi:integrase